MYAFTLDYFVTLLFFTVTNRENGYSTSVPRLQWLHGLQLLHPGGYVGQTGLFRTMSLSTAPWPRTTQRDSGVPGWTWRSLVNFDQDLHPVDKHRTCFDPQIAEIIIYNPNLSTCHVLCFWKLEKIENWFANRYISGIESACKWYQFTLSSDASSHISSPTCIGWYRMKSVWIWSFWICWTAPCWVET